MTDTARKNFLGIPISGQINAGERAVEQYPREAFEQIVRRFLDDPFFVEFGWTQYTPYFNDGDPCIFSANEIWVRTADDQKVLDEDGYEVDAYEVRERLGVNYGTHPTLGGREYPNGYSNPAVYAGTRESQWLLARELNAAIEGGHFNNVLMDLFGDHCEVTVARTGITVDEYSHD